MSRGKQMFGGMRPASVPGRRSKGFTLIELLVVLLILTLLIAAIAPVVMQQVGAGDAARVAEDLEGIANATSIFRTDVRTFPGDLEDLVNQITVGAPDTNIAGVLYTALQRNRWKGPYLNRTLSATGDVGTAFVTAFDGEIQWDVFCYIADSTVPNHRHLARTAANCAATGRQVWVAVLIRGLGLSGFNAVNAIIDGPGDTLATGAGDSLSGRLRRRASGATADTTIFLAVPIPLP